MDENTDKTPPPFPPLSSKPLSEEELARRRRLGEEAARKRQAALDRQQRLTDPRNLRRLGITAGTMAIALIAAGLYYGWLFGTGFVLLIFLHECGHVWAARRLGLPIGDMVFLPFFGAFVTLQQRKDMAEGAFVALMGPVFGAAGSVVSTAIGYVTGNPLFIDLAVYNFGITLLNLVPLPPLDGSWLAPVLFARPRKHRHDREGKISRDDQRRLGGAYLALALVGVCWYYLPMYPFLPGRLEIR